MVLAILTAILGISLGMIIAIIALIIIFIFLLFKFPKIALIIGAVLVIGFIMQPVFLKYSQTGSFPDIQALYTGNTLTGQQICEKAGYTNYNYFAYDFESCMNIGGNTVVTWLTNDYVCCSRVKSTWEKITFWSDE